VTATFRLAETLTVTRSGEGSGSVASDPAGISCGTACAASFPRGSQVTLTATPSLDSSFAGWSGACTGTGTCLVTLDAAAAVDARFEPRFQTVAVTRTGSGVGSVTSSPAGIDCGDVCSATFRAGSSVTLSASAADGSTFAGWSGACGGTGACTFTVAADVSVSARFEPAPQTLTVPDAATSVTYASWRGIDDPAASGGSYRVSDVRNETIRWVSPRTTALTWIARAGPDRGRASVTIDGAAKGTIDLYATTPGSRVTRFSGLSDSRHTVVITVLGTKRSASTGTTVAHDAFAVGSTVIEDSAPETRYGSWEGFQTALATDGTYRASSTTGAVVEIAFTGTRIDWITSMGRDRGKATVTIDGVSRGTVDLYAPSTVWGTELRFGGLSNGPHRLVIKVLGTKNSSATGRRVIVDGFVVHP